MFYYENQVCDVCGKPFNTESDIVVCPECGTPHHRECWNELGHCVNKDKHSEVFEWKPVINELDHNSIKCQNCGNIMPKDTMFCENCGNALAPSNEAIQSYNGPGQTKIDVYGGSLFDIQNVALRERIDRELAGEIDGVPIKDIAVYIGPNAQYYIYKFKKMVSNPNYHPFNWTAFLFTPLWLLFRKMWKFAIGAALINFIFNIPAIIIIAVQRGQLPASSPLMFTGIETVANFMSIIIILLGVIIGFIATPLYKKETIKNLKKMREEAPNQEAYYRNVVEQSGPSKVGLIITSIFAVFYIITMFMF